MRLRVLSALGIVVAAALATTSLTACTQKATTVATVNGHRISSDDLTPYLTGQGVSAKVQAAAKKNHQGVEPPSVEVARRLVQQQVFRTVLAKTGTVPNAAALAKLHDPAAQTFLSAQVGGAQFDSEIDAQVKAYGLTPRYREMLLTTVELEAALAVRLKSSSLDGFFSDVGKHPVQVKLNPSYGKWVPGQLTTTDPKTPPPAPNGAIPSFITISTASAPSNG